MEIGENLIEAIPRGGGRHGGRYWSAEAEGGVAGCSSWWWWTNKGEKP